MKAYRNDQSVTLVTGQDARKKDRTKEKVDDYKCVTRAENLYPENFVTLMFNLLKGEMLSNFIFSIQIEAQITAPMHDNLKCPKRWSWN